MKLKFGEILRTPNLDRNLLVLIQKSTARLTLCESLLNQAEHRFRKIVKAKSQA